jgi:hypothetical protein
MHTLVEASSSESASTTPTAIQATVGRTRGERDERDGEHREAAGLREAGSGLRLGRRRRAEVEAALHGAEQVAVDAVPQARARRRSRTSPTATRRARCRACPGRQRGREHGGVMAAPKRGPRTSMSRRPAAS